MADNKRIAKNTLFLYFRMFIVMGISLYTSRIVLEKLGIDNYGIYQAVGGIVGLMSFINGALSTGISRFITFGLGKRDFLHLQKIFSTIISVQFFIIIFIVLVTETVGLWFVTHKLDIPAESYNAAIWTYHISIFTTCIGLLCVPYDASIIAHEKINFYAYTGIFDVSAKLGIVYLLTIGPFNRLVMYAWLMLAVAAIGFLIKIVFCYKKFPECHYKFIFDRKIFKDIAKFSGWSLISNASIALNGQGILVLLNMFFSPAVVAARAISLQVNGAATQFVNNFRTAANPQIIKHYAAGELLESKQLLLFSTKISFFMMLILSLPICLGSYNLLHVWLKEVPPYAVIFLQLVVVQSLFQVFDQSFYIALYAKGDIKLNALISPVISILCFPIVYLLFKFGCSPVALSWAMLICYAILGLFVKPLLIIKIVDYTWEDIFSVFKPCLSVAAIAGFSSWLIITLLNPQFNDFLNLVISTSICLAICLPTIYFIGFDKEMRGKVNKLISSKLPFRKKSNN